MPRIANSHRLAAATAGKALRVVVLVVVVREEQERRALDLAARRLAEIIIRRDDDNDVNMIFEGYVTLFQNGNSKTSCRRGGRRLG